MNINDKVRVELTPAGQARWRGLFGTTPDSLCEISLWELMSIFGPTLNMGMTEMYFKNNEIEILK